MAAEEISITTLARELNTTASTVSRALNGRPGVSHEKAQSIRAYAERLGYKPTPYYNRRSNCLAMIFPDGEVDSRDEQFQRRLIYAAERYASKIGKFLFVNFVPFRAENLPQLLQERRVDGVLLASHPPRQLVDRIRRQGLPIVALEDMTLRLSCDCVIANPQNGAIALLERLLAAGHRRFSLVITDRRFPSVDRRFRAFEMNLAEHGLSPSGEYILDNVESSLAGGGAAAQKLMALPELPDAVIFTNDHIAFGAMLEFAKAGIAIPERISVASFDNSELCERALPPLTSVELHSGEVIQAGIDRLIHLIESPDGQPGNYTQIEIDSSLVWRRSCRDR